MAKNSSVLHWMLDRMLPQITENECTKGQSNWMNWLKVIQTINHDKLKQVDECLYPDRIFIKNGEIEIFLKKCK